MLIAAAKCCWACLIKLKIKQTVGKKDRPTDDVTVWAAHGS